MRIIKRIISFFKEETVPVETIEEYVETWQTCTRCYDRGYIESIDQDRTHPVKKWCGCKYTDGKHPKNSVNEAHEIAIRDDDEDGEQDIELPDTYDVFSPYLVVYTVYSDDRIYYRSYIKKSYGDKPEWSQLSAWWINRPNWGRQDCRADKEEIERILDMLD